MRPVASEPLHWSDLVFVMECAHRNRLSARFGPHLHGKRVVCPDFPCDVDFMAPDLVCLPKAKAPRHLPSV